MISKEERFRELIDCLYTGDYSVEIRVNGQIKRIKFYNSKGQWLIDYNEENGCAWISYNRIWSVFYKEYNMKYHETQSFMKDMLLMYLKIMGTTPNSCGLSDHLSLLMYLKIMGTTPLQFDSLFNKQLLMHFNGKETTPKRGLLRLIGCC